MIGGVLRGGLAFEVAGRAGEEVDVVDTPGHVELGGEPHRLARLADLLGDQGVGMLGGQLRQLGEHRDRSAGVAVAQLLRAARADATAVSTSPGDASAYSATAAPVAGLMTRCRPPPVTTGAPSIQLPATSGYGLEKPQSWPNASRRRSTKLRISAARKPSNA